MNDTVDKSLLADKMFALWEMMAELEVALWDLFPEEFADRCIEHFNKPEDDPLIETRF